MVTGITTPLLHAILLVVYRLEAKGQEILEPANTVTQGAKEKIATGVRWKKKAVQPVRLEMQTAFVSLIPKF